MGRYKQPYSLHKRGKYWYYQTYDARGVRTVAKSTGLTSKSQAKDFCESLVKNNRLLSCRMKFKDYATGFYDEGGRYLARRISSITENTLKGWRTKLNNRIIPVLGEMEISDITIAVVSEFRAEMLRAGIPYPTVRQTMQSLKYCLDYAYQDNLMERIQWDLLERIPAAKQVKRDGFTMAEAEDIFIHLPMDIRDLFLVLILTGVRISEAYGLRQDDILEDSGVKYIHLTKQLIKGEYRELKTKTERDLPICEELIPLIHELGYSTPYIYESFNPNIRRCNEWEKRKLSIHSTRHFFITECKNNNINPQKVEQYAGHSLRGMQEVYTAFHIHQYDEIVEWQKKTLAHFQQLSLVHPSVKHGLFANAEARRLKPKRVFYTEIAKQNNKSVSRYILDQI